MSKKLNVSGVPCAAGRTADSASAEVKKKYVPPRMQVIPLGPQRLLTTSGEVPPVWVTIYGVPPTDYYRYIGGGRSTCLTEAGWVPGCPSLFGRTFVTESLYHTGRMHYGLTEGDGNYCWGADWDVKNYAGQVFFDGADWDAGEFFAYAEFDECSDPSDYFSGTFSGTYLGRRFTGEIIPL